jgi:nucleoside-diphosphate kinase
MIEQTLVLLKPDCIMRGFMGEIISRFEKAGFKVTAMEMVWHDKEFFREHYHDVAERHSEEILKMNLDAMTTGPVVAMVLEGVNAVENVRKMVGPTEPRKAAPGTIRGDYSAYTYGLADERKIAVRNLLHASADKSDAEREVKLWFKSEEIHSYKTVHDLFVA